MTADNWNSRTTFINAIIALSVLNTLGGCCWALQAVIPSHNAVPCFGHRHYHRRPSISLPPFQAPSASSRSILPLSVSATSSDISNNSSDTDEDDDALLESIDPTTLQNLCSQYSLSTSGTKTEMLARLRNYAAEQAELDQQRRRGRTQRVETGLEGKARHEILTDDQIAEAEVEDGMDELQGYFYYQAAESEADKAKLHAAKMKLKKEQLAKSRPASHLTAPPPPKNIQVNEKGERVATIYSTTDKNDLTGTSSQNPMADMSLENAAYQQKSLGEGSAPEESLIGGPFGDTSGSRRKKADSAQVEAAKDGIKELVVELLATTGAPAFQDDYEEGDDIVGEQKNEFANPYGFVGFQAERIPIGLLVKSSVALRADGGGALKEVLSEFELQAIGHDGMAADDTSQGGGHYREVVKVSSFLEGYRKAEERRVARDTSTMLLDRLVKEGVKGLDLLMSGMVREGDDASYMQGDEAQGGELNGALVRYLEEAIREQEQRVKSEKGSGSVGDSSIQPPQDIANEKEDAVDLVWNVTRGDDGTIIETIDPNNPLIGQILREELEKTKEGSVLGEDDSLLLSLTVQEKMLLLLKLLRDRVKVEAVIGNDVHARNLRILAYALKAANDEERHQLILEEFGNSLDALDVFADLITASIDYTEARYNDDEFMPGNNGQKASISPVLNISKLQKIQIIVERIKTNQSWKASGISQ